VERNRKAGKNPPKVVAPIEEEKDVKSLKEMSLGRPKRRWEDNKLYLKATQ
jgi:hypothetical protein